MMYLENYTMRETYTGCYDITIHQIDSSLEKNQCRDEILSNVLNTPGLIRVNTQSIWEAIQPDCQYSGDFYLLR